MPCATCTLIHGDCVLGDDDRINSGFDMISLDAVAKDGHDFGDQPMHHQPRPRSIHGKAMDMTGHFLRSLCMIGDHATQRIILLRMAGHTFKEIGVDIGVSKQEAWRRFHNARREWPALGDLFKPNTPPPGQRRKRMPKRKAAQ